MNIAEDSGTVRWNVPELLTWARKQEDIVVDLWLTE